MPKKFDGLTFLVVEDEPLIAMDIVMILEAHGAAITSTTTLKHAMLLVEHDGIAAAVVDHALGDDDATALLARLKELNIPYLVYSGYEIEGEQCLSKPAAPDQLVEALGKLIGGQPHD